MVEADVSQERRLSRNPPPPHTDVDIFEHRELGTDLKVLVVLAVTWRAPLHRLDWRPKAKVVDGRVRKGDAVKGYQIHVRLVHAFHRAVIGVDDRRRLLDWRGARVRHKQRSDHGKLERNGDHHEGGKRVNK